MNKQNDPRRAVMRFLDVVFPLVDAGLIINGIYTVFRIGYEFLVRREGHFVVGVLHILTNIGLLLIALASLASLRLYTHPPIPTQPPKLSSPITPFKAPERRELNSHNSHIRAWILNVSSSMKPPDKLDNKIQFNTCRKNPCAVRNNWKPPRTHHCSSCAACRVGFDHHCPWIGTCLTANLLPRFALFLTCIALVPVLSLAPLFVIHAPRSVAFSPLNLQISPPSVIPVEASFTLTSTEFPFRDAVLPSRLRSAYVYSRSSQHIREAWWDKPYSWFLVMGPIGRVPVGVILGIRELERAERHHMSEEHGNDIARPGVSLVLTAGSGLLFSIFALIMCIVTVRHAQEGMTTLEAQFPGGDIVYPKVDNSTEENEASNLNPAICIWLALDSKSAMTIHSTESTSLPTSENLGVAENIDALAIRPKELIITKIVLSPEQLDAIHLYSARHATLRGFLREGLYSTAQFFLHSCRGPLDADSTSTLDFEGRWGGWEWPAASEAITKIALESEQKLNMKVARHATKEER